MQATSFPESKRWRSASPVAATRGPWRRARCTSEEYEACAALHNQVFPEEPVTPAELRCDDERAEPGFVRERWICWLGERIVGFALGCDPFWSTGPNRHFIRLVVDPSYRRRGLGSAWLAMTTQRLLARSPEPWTLMTETYEDQADAISFLEARGFGCAMRTARSKIDLASFDERPFLPTLERVLASGMRIRSLAELRDSDPAWQRRWYELATVAVQDIPYPEPIQERSFESFFTVVDHPAFSAECSWIAVDADGTYAAESCLWRRPADPTLMTTGITAVRRAYRRRGLATALKTHALLDARTRGVLIIDTHNEENNPMLDINRRFGFEAAPTEVEYRRTLRAGDRAD